MVVPFTKFTTKKSIILISKIDQLISVIGINKHPEITSLSSNWIHSVMSKKVVVIYSGGMDSYTVLHKAIEEGLTP